MSAWIVTKDHIDVLVTAIQRNESIETEGLAADEIGRELWRENFRSVNYRYNERRRTPEYNYQPYPPPADATDATLWLLKQVACYQYQSRERPDWGNTRAYRWSEALRELLTAQSEAVAPGADPYDRPGYGDAPWGV